MEHELARRWRERHKLSRPKLAELTGYSPLAIYWMERGLSARGKPVWPQVWQRYKMACAAVHARLTADMEFSW